MGREGSSRQAHEKTKRAWSSKGLLISKGKSLSLRECPWSGQTSSRVETSQAAHSRGNLGSLQLEVRLRDETVLPSACYQPLVQLLCQDVKLGTQVRSPWGAGSTHA